MKNLDEISTVLFVCKDIIETGTSVLGDEISSELMSLNLDTDVKLLDTYRKRLFELKTIYGKLQKYPDIFSNFYNPGAISNEDALEYHVHSFLADTYAYREKVSGLLGKIQNSIPKELKEDRGALESIKNIFLDNFEPITKIRKNHTHGHVDNGWYLDGGALRVRNYKSSLAFLNMDGIKETVNWKYVNEKMAKEQEEANEELEKSKERWIKNSTEVLSMVENNVPKIFKAISFTIYKTLNINTAADILTKHFIK